ncbi:MAG: FAD-dependent oxidoreductase, partial [Glaciihabitans sp.]|nr:FAD-dependent oxidoreductase [Glaciihabitans sp.]
MVIVGAGASGLTAATDLRAVGLSVTVLEARDRVGGRLWTNSIDGQTFEIGGQWVSPDQEALIETLGTLGLDTYPRFRDGESVYVAKDGTAGRFSGEIFPTSAVTQDELRRLIETLDTLTAEINVRAPWEH